MICFLPWKLKRWCLVNLYGYDIDKTAKIGLSYIFPEHLVMKAHSRIGHFNVAIHLTRMELGEHSSIARSNWITGFPEFSQSLHFAHDQSRKSELVVGKHSALTKNHHVDCTNAIHIGDYVTIAGYRSQFLTHSIDIVEGRQDSHPITIGDYCFVSTGVKILGGAILPDHSVLAAGAVLTKQFIDSYSLYGGVPAKKIKEISKESKYMNRAVGYVI